MLLAGFATQAHSGQAEGEGPPTPPPVPSCAWCAGPPPPPTLVPTAAPTVVKSASAAKAGAAGYVFGVTISPRQVRRGRSVKVAITAPKGERLVIAVTYWRRKPTFFKGTLDHDPPYVKIVKVPAAAPTGKGTIKVRFFTFSGSTGAKPISVPFTVLK
ncbi:MAG: hypothetical protein DLM70_13060 [Chloroflexi bacterium]|nr:MAG: hypothetical protein DLM70_13060 [Chloroflexota bacterium]